MSEQKPCFMCDPSILEQGQRCATGAPICDRHRDQLTGNMRPPTAEELALTARAEAAEQQAARLNHDLTYLLDVAREVSDGEASRTALRVAVDQIKLGVFHRAASQPTPADEAMGRLRTVAQDGHIVGCCWVVFGCCSCTCDEGYRRDYELRFPLGGQAEGEG